MNNSSYSQVKVEKFDGVLDWDKQSNYAEAMELMKIAKDINQEKRRRKQLKDAGLARDEISRIIKNERYAKLNNNKMVNNVSNTIKTTETRNNNNIDKTLIYDESSNKFINSNNIENSNTTTNNKVEINPYYQNSNTLDVEVLRNDLNKQNDNNAYLYNSVSNNENRAQHLDQVREIDLTVKAPIVKLKTDEYNDTNINSNKTYIYDDFMISRILNKVADNINNPEDFAIYAKEFSKIANGKKQTKLEMPEILPVTIVEDDDDNLENDEDYDDVDKNTSRFYKHANGKSYYKNKTKNVENTKNKKHKNKYQTNLANLYATNVEYDNYTKKNKSKKNNKQNKNGTNFKNMKNGSNNGEKYLTNEKHRIFYTNDDNNNENDENSDVYTMDEDEIEYEQSLVSEKQVRAKDVGVQYPVKREKNTHKTQYQPQNIAQIAYDKNNKHLQPIVFENHIINQVFDNLGSEDAIPLARALINKVGKTDIADEDGNTLLMHAVARHNQSLIAMLLAEGANPNTLNNDGFSPLHLAASNGDNTAIYSLMMGGGNPNVRDKDGNTSLMYAAKMCNEQSIKMMMSLGGDPTIVNKSTGRTAMDFAGENDNPYVLSLLEIQTKKLRQNKNPVNLTTELTS